MKAPFYYLLLALVPLAAPAQVLTNNGAVLTVASGATLSVGGGILNQAGGTLSNAGRLLLSGDLTNAATLASPGRLVFLGTQAQTLTPGTAATLGRVQVSNTGAVAGGQNVLTVAGNVTVTDSLVLRQGLVRTPASVTIDLPATGVLAGEASGRYVQGNIRTVRPAVSGPTDFGLSFALDGSGQSLGTVTVTRTAGLQAADVSYGQGVGAAKGIDRIWTVSSQQAPTAALPLTMSWLPDDDNGLTDFSQAAAWRQNALGAPWVLAGAAQNASATRQVSGQAATLGRFTVSNAQNPLPVTLVAFTAERQGPDALLRWTTASELHSAYFEVESSADGRSFRALGRVAAAGSSSTPRAYQFPDPTLARYGSALVYYRLRQVDADGTVTYSPVRTLEVPASGWFVQAYPNPSLPTTPVSVRIETGLAGEAQLTLTDALGRLVSRQAAGLQPGTTTLPLAGTDGLATGVYVLRVQQGQQQQTLKLVRQ